MGVPWCPAPSESRNGEAARPVTADGVTRTDGLMDGTRLAGAPACWYARFGGA